MKNRHLPVILSGTCLALAAIACSGCDKKAPETAPTTKANEARGHEHAEGDAHDHADDHEHGDEHGHGVTTELGEQSLDGMTIRASRDGAITPGGDVPIDVWVTGLSEPVAAVRFWVGSQDGRGSVKAKAELEKDNWHSHAEVPSPLPEASQLWVEVETERGTKHLVSFDLKL